MPEIQDIFTQRPFRTLEMTTGLTSIPWEPALLGQLGERLFQTKRIVGRYFGISQTERGLVLIPVSAEGEAPVELEGETAGARAFKTSRLAKGSTIYARDLVGVQNAPLGEAVRTMQGEVATRASVIRQHFEYTNEHMRFGCILGKVIDANGTTVIDNWYANWGVAEPDAFDFDLDTSTTDLRAKSYAARKAVKDGTKGAWINGRSEVHALCGDTFFEKYFNHKYFRDTYVNTNNAGVLRELNPDTETRLGITWHRWDGPTTGAFGLAADEARFFPVGVPDTFHRVLGSAEFMPWVFSPGQDLYALTVPDRDRNSNVRIEFYQYPAYVCLRPETLQRAVADE